LFFGFSFELVDGAPLEKKFSITVSLAQVLKKRITLRAKASEGYDETTMKKPPL
jgi:hypothetical protein